MPWGNRIDLGGGHPRGNTFGERHPTSGLPKARKDDLSHPNVALQGCLHGRGMCQRQPYRDVKSAPGDSRKQHLHSDATDVVHFKPKDRLAARVENTCRTLGAHGGFVDHQRRRRFAVVPAAGQILLHPGQQRLKSRIPELKSPCGAHPFAGPAGLAESMVDIDAVPGVLQRAEGARIPTQMATVGAGEPEEAEFGG